jgi:hypothetical protein
LRAPLAVELRQRPDRCAVRGLGYGLFRLLRLAPLVLPLRSITGFAWASKEPAKPTRKAYVAAPRFLVSRHHTLTFGGYSERTLTGSGAQPIGVPR